MKPTTHKKRKPHSPERRKSIGLSKERKVTESELKQLIEWWSLGYVSPAFIKQQMSFGEKVYQRLLKEHCLWEQISFIPTNMTPIDIEYIIRSCKDEIPYKTIANDLGRHHKQIRRIVDKLSEKYKIKPHNLPRYSPKGKHLDEITSRIIVYNKTTKKTGSKNGNWKGGTTSLSEKIRKHDKYKLWRLDVFEADKFTCQICNSKEEIQADHIKPFCIIIKENKIDSLRSALKCVELWDRSNGRTLCKICHRKQPTHGIGAIKWKNT